MLEWTSRHTALTVPQVREWLVNVEGSGQSQSIAFARLKVLREAGLIESERIFARGGAALWITTEGLQTLGHTGTSSRPRVSQLLHDLSVADLALELVVTKPTHRLVTERELRRIDTTNQHETGAHQWASKQVVGGRVQNVFPDLVTVAPSGRRVVHEVEMTGKNHSRLVRLMLSHLSNDEVGAARYYASPALVPEIEKAAEEARRAASVRGLDGIVTVHERELHHV